MINLVIADDEPNMRHSLENLYPWKQLDIQIVYAASNGKKALEYIQLHPVHILLADIRMPTMDGLELAQHVHEQFPDIRILILSAYSDFNYAKRAMHCGVYEYVTKPINYERFCDTLSKIHNSFADISQSETYQGYYQEIMQKVKLYIDADPSTATLMGAAERTGLSANYLSQLFRQYNHQTFSCYLTRCRMRQAAYLLKTDVSVSDTAWQCGYANIRAFNQTFRKHFGVTPYIYQNMFKED